MSAAARRPAIPIPPRLALIASGGVSARTGERLLLEKLRVLWAWLDRRLDEPPEIVERGALRVVLVLGHVGYAFGAKACHAWAVQPDGRGGFATRRHGDDLGRPLRHPQLLDEAVRRLGLSDTDPQPGLFSPRRPPSGRASQHDAWIARAAIHWLHQDPRFRELRLRSLPQALALDPKVLRLARLARPLPEGMSLPAIDYSLAWQHRALYAQVHAETPKLLPLVKLGLHVRVVRAASNVVGQLKDGLRAQGISEAGWRYVARHGAKLFRPAWRVAQAGPSLHAAVQYLRVLQAARLPPPPPPSLARAWLDAYGDDLHFRPRWNDVPVGVLELAMREADRRRRLPTLKGLVLDFGNVAPWARDERIWPGKQLQRAGWENLVRRLWDTIFEEREVAVLEGARWASALGECTIDGIRVVPLDSDAALLDEGIAMRHCARDYAEGCVTGKVRIFSLRDPQSGDRIATVGLALGKGRVTPFDVKAAGNRDCGGREWEVAWKIAQAYPMCRK